MPETIPLSKMGVVATIPLSAIVVVVVMVVEVLLLLLLLAIRVVLCRARARLRLLTGGDLPRRRTSDILRHAPATAYIQNPRVQRVTLEGAKMAFFLLFLEG